MAAVIAAVSVIVPALCYKPHIFVRKELNYIVRKARIIFVK